MKFRALTIAFLILSMMLGSLPLMAQDTGLPDLEGMELVVAVDNKYPPFSLISEDSGEAIGWDYDAFNYICELLNCVPDFVPTSWDGLFEAMSAGQFDVSGDGVTITEARDEVIDYSIPYMEYGQILSA
jgi:polar amino acid transport system substrate-binding protein